MAKWAIILLALALISGVLGYSGVLEAAINIAWILGVVSLILLVIQTLRRRQIR